MGKKEFGIICRKLRRERDLTIEVLAAMVGVRHSTISTWEAGQNYPSIGTVLRLDQIFDGKLLDSPDVRPWAVNGGVK